MNASWLGVGDQPLIRRRGTSPGDVIFAELSPRCCCGSKAPSPSNEAHLMLDSRAAFEVTRVSWTSIKKVLGGERNVFFNLKTTTLPVQSFVVVPFHIPYSIFHPVTSGFPPQGRCRLRYGVFRATYSGYIHYLPTLNYRSAVR